MNFGVSDSEKIIQRVRAILVTKRGTLMLIKRVKPGKAPYWVAPGGGVEEHDKSLSQTLERELCEELGAVAEIVDIAFVMHHEIAGKNLEEHFYICKLLNYDLSMRNGPEFNDPTRGQYIPDEIPLTFDAINNVEFKTPEIQQWLLAHLDILRAL